MCVEKKCGSWWFSDVKNRKMGETFLRVEVCAVCAVFAVPYISLHKRTYALDFCCEIAIGRSHHTQTASIPFHSALLLICYSSLSSWLRNCCAFYTFSQLALCQVLLPLFIYPSLAFGCRVSTLLYLSFTLPRTRSNWICIVNLMICDWNIGASNTFFILSSFSSFKPHWHLGTMFHQANIEPFLYIYQRWNT